MYDGSYERIGGKDIVMNGLCRFYFLLYDFKVKRVAGGVNICFCGCKIRRIVGWIK